MLKDEQEEEPKEEMMGVKEIRAYNKYIWMTVLDNTVAKLSPLSYNQNYFGYY